MRQECQLAISCCFNFGRFKIKQQLIAHAEISASLHLCINLKNEVCAVMWKKVPNSSSKRFRAA